MKNLIVLLITSLFLTSCSADNTNNNVATTSFPSVALKSATTNEISKQTEPIIWHDKALEKLVRNKINKVTGDIFVDELNNITELYIWGVTEKKVVSYDLLLPENEYTDEEGHKYSEFGEIKSIEDLKLFKNLKYITLCHQKINDFLPLQDLPQLESLVLTGNRINDLYFVSQLKNLRTLIIDYNYIENFKGLYALESLVYLDASYNDIATLTGIESCKGIETLIIEQDSRRPRNSTKISDISLLGGLTSLEKLSMLSQNIEDLTPLSKLSNLKYLNVQDNNIWDFAPLRNLKKLQTLKISNSDITNNLAFLRNLPDLKDIDLSEDKWKKINYPFKLTSADLIEGIYPGNIMNGGAVGFDGKNVYYEEISYGDLGHPQLVKFDNENYLTQSISGQITEQMSNIIGQKPGGTINERVSYLNIYKGKLYFMGDGSNNDTADALEDGSYYQGDEVVGLTRMNSNGSDRVTLSKDKFSYICVINDRIYCLNKDKYPVSMNLYGADIQILLKKPCNMLYTDGKLIYYQLNNSSKYLYSMEMDGSQATVLLKISCNKPIIFRNEIYYLNQKGNICLYTMEKQQHKTVSNCKADFFNVNGQYIYYSNEKGIYRIDKEGQNSKQIYTGNAGSINVIGDYIIFGIVDGYCKIKNDGSEYTEYFQYY